jgi:hypothetical protein
MSQSNVRIIKCLAYSFVKENSKKNGGYCSLYIITDKMKVAPVKRPIWTWIILWLWPFYVRTAFKKAEQNLNLQLDIILDDDKDNYQIQNNSIRKIEMKKGSKMWGGPRITVQTEDGKHVFMVTTWEVDKQDAIVEDFNKIFGKRFMIEK